MPNSGNIGAETFRIGGPSPGVERGCGPGEASRPEAACWRVSSHERDHDRSVLRPSANRPCCTKTPQGPAEALLIDEPATATRATPANH